MRESGDGRARYVAMSQQAAVGPSAGDNRPLIAHAIHRLDVGGMENGLVNLINGLPADRFRHAIVCVTKSSDFANRLHVDNVRIYELHKRKGKDFAVYFRFWRLLRKLKPTILHTRNLGTLDFVLVAKLAGVPLRIHGEHGWDAGDVFGQSRRYRLLRRVCDVAVSEYVAVSKDIKRWLCDVAGVSADRVQQIYNGVDVQHFNPKGRVAKLGFGDEQGNIFVIGTVGRLDRIKNFDLLIRAFAKVVARRSSDQSALRLVIVGDGPEMKHLRNLVAELGLEDIVLLTGRRTDISELLRSMRLFVLPSKNEGISNTVLESMATGLPVIATGVGGSPELVVDGETGFLVSPNDLDALEAAIDRYLSNPKLVQSHGRAARERVVRVFGLRTMLESYKQLYDRLLGTRQPQGIH